LGRQSALKLPGFSALFCSGHETAACFPATNAAHFARFIRKTPVNSVFLDFEDVMFDFNLIRK
jgi:hypothetical protein